MEFERSLAGALEIAALCPSSHNCQPWALAALTSADSRCSAASILGANHAARETDVGFLALGLDQDRLLRALPAHAVEMNVSCGMYLRLLIRAFEASGWRLGGIRFAEPTGKRTLDETWSQSWPASPLCLFELRRSAPTDGASLAALTDLVHRRRTNRAPYESAPIADHVEQLAAAARAPAFGAAPVDTAHLTGAELSRFARFVARHGGRDFSDRAAWRETHDFLRWSDERARARGDGFSLTQLFGPLSPLRRALMWLALAPATMRLLARVGYHRFLARQLGKLVEQSPAVVAMHFGSASPTVEEQLEGGARLIDYWLAATELGLALHPVSVVLQHDDLRRSLQAALGIEGRLFFASRLGRPTAAFPPAPRRPPRAALSFL